jgi:hypothetical protein
MARATNLAGLESRVVVPCGGRTRWTREDTKSMQATEDWWQNRTFLALARVFGRSAENSNESLGVWRTSHAGRLGGQFLIEVPKEDVATDAAELPLVWLEVTYRATRRAALAERARVGTKTHPPYS